jgi:hypothetical protein
VRSIPRSAETRGLAVAPVRPSLTSPQEPLVLYVREDCPLCDQFAIELGLELDGAMDLIRFVDVDADPELATRYGLRVPVLECRGVVAGEGRFDRGRFRTLYPV